MAKPGNMVLGLAQAAVSKCSASPCKDHRVDRVDRVDGMEHHLIFGFPSGNVAMDYPT
jgi:hypothetical protein